MTATTSNVEETLKSLESSIAAIIAEGFLNNCISRRKLKTALRHRQLSLVGISSQPEDKTSGSCKLLYKISCKTHFLINDNLTASIALPRTRVACALAVLEAGEKCDVVDGGLTVYVEGDANSTASQILDMIENQMDPVNGSLQNVAGVKELIYFVPDPDLISEAPGAEKGTDANEREIARGGGLSVTAAVFASVATVAFVLVGFFAGRKYLNKEEEEEAEQDLEVNASDEFEETPVDSSDDINESGLVMDGNSIMNSSGSVTVSSSFAK